MAGHRLMQAACDIFLGWQRTEAGLDGKQRDFYVRQLRDWTYSIAIESLIPRGMRIDKAVTRFASAYADQNERDHKELVDAVASGQLPAERDM